MNAKRALVLIPFLVQALSGSGQGPNRLQSNLQIVNIESKKVQTILSLKQHIEAPNWSKDGSFFIVNSKGRLYTVPLNGKNELTEINTDFADQCNNDHGISPDGKYLVISHNKPVGNGRSSSIYLVPLTGGKPVEVTTKSPSYWHGWSPDGQTLTYCAERDGNYDVYTIPVSGGKEIRLTTAEGLDDGPEYSHDGKYIYYNSFKNGSMQLWRMKTDGTEQKQLTNDALSNWFPHPSPDGKWVVFISYLQDQGQSHPFGKNVKLRLMSLEDNTIVDLTDAFYGGQGSINVPSWSPDSKQVAFVTYKELN
jgi:TolB protein